MLSKIEHRSPLVLSGLLLVILLLIAIHTAIVLLVFPIVMQVKSLGIYRGFVGGGIGAIVNLLGFIALQPSNRTATDGLISSLVILSVGLLITQYLTYHRDHDKQANEVDLLKAELHQSRAQLQAFRTALPDRAFIFDENGYYVDVISQLISDDRQHFLIGKHIADIPEVVKYDDAMKIVDAIQKTIKTGESHQLEYQAFTSKDKMWCWLQGRSSLLQPTADSPALVIWLSRDITERKQTEDHLNKVQHLAQIGTWETDVSANYVTWSDEMYKIYGISPADFDHTVEFATARIHPDDLIVFRDNLKKGINPYPTEYRIIRPDKTIRTVFAVGETIYNEAGELTKRIGLLQDITDRKQAEEDHFQLQSEKQHTLALHNLINNVTHDIMSPLTIIKTSLYILGKTDDPEKQYNHLNQVKERVEMLQKLFENLLKISFLTSAKLDNLAPKDVNIVSLLQGLSHQYEALAEDKNQSLTCSLPDETIMLWMDEDYMWQAISNLLQNAVQYTPENGQLHLSLTEEPTDLIISVEDNGVGISADHQRHILDGFYRVEEHRPIDGSSGLGLYMANLIIKLHGGTIDIDSSPDLGSKFHVTLAKTQNITT